MENTDRAYCLPGLVLERSDVDNPRILRLQQTLGTKISLSLVPNDRDNGLHDFSTSVGTEGQAQDLLALSL